jgi:hypothetical protein
MEVKEAILIAKRYISEIYAEEHVSNLGLEEVEYEPESENWLVTVAFSRPWNTPRTPADQALEGLGITSGRLKRSYKTLVISPDGKVLSMKSRETTD